MLNKSCRRLWKGSEIRRPLRQDRWSTIEIAAASPSAPSSVSKGSTGPRLEKELPSLQVWGIFDAALRLHDTP
jgi:hypothetical protein